MKTKYRSELENLENGTFWCFCLRWLQSSTYTAYNISLRIVFLAPKTTFTCVDTNLTTDIQNSTCYSDCRSYEYYSQFENTIISEWNLICGREWLADLTQTAIMVGVLIGSIIFGFIADRYGRRPAILIACMLQLCASFATGLCTDFWVFAATRFILGISTAGNMVGSYVLLMELSGPTCREIATCVYHIPFPIAEITAPIFAYFLPSWNTFSSIGIAVPTLIYLTYFFILPESPKWLISTGRLKEASVVMTKAAKMNKLNTDGMLDTVKLVAQEANVNKEKLQDKIPSFVCCGYLIKRFGRRSPTIAFCLIGGVCSGLFIFDTGYISQLVIGVTGLVSITCGFTTLYTFTAELFPTVARNMAMGASSTTSRMGAALAPFIVGLKTEASWLPPTVFAVLPVAAVVACLCLPETKGKKVADTLDMIDE